MKKAVVLGMILLALGVMAYADAVTVGMDFGRTQFNVASGSSASGSPINQGWVGPTGTFPTGQRLDMQFAWSNDHMGINITDYVSNGNGGLKVPGVGTFVTNDPNQIVNAYGTLKFMPDMFTMYIGEFNGDGWDHFRLDSAHPIHDMDNNSIGRFKGWGAILDLMPKDSGIDIALYAKLTDPSVPGYTFQNQTIGEALSQYNVAASYTVPNTVKIAVGSGTFADAKALDQTATAPGFSERNLFAEVTLLMVPNLSAFDTVYYAGFDQQSNKLAIISDELALSYDMKPLTIILAAFIGQNADSGAPNYAPGSNYMAWAAYPELIYNMGAISLGLYAGVAGNNISGSEIGYTVEPYVKLNDFGFRVSFLYNKSTTKGAASTWEVPILIDWGF
jgi:hypothetical protein